MFIAFSLRRDTLTRQMRINDEVLVISATARYLGLYLDSKLTWLSIYSYKKYTEGSNNENLLDRRFPLSIDSNRLLYHQLILPR